MTKISLTNLVNLQNETTAVNAINANNAVLVAALDNTVSRDGTSPNTLTATLDANSQQILNLPTPATANSPVRLADVQAGGTITNIPSGGTTGQVLAKTSNTNYAIGWTSESAELAAGTNIVLTGSTPTTISTTTTPTFTTVNGNTLTTGTGVLTLAAAKTLTASNTLTLAGTDATTITFQGTDTYVGRATTDTLTNKTLTSPTLVTPALGTPASGNLSNCTAFPVGGITSLGTGVSTALQANVSGSGSIALTTSPVFTTPNIDTATASSINKVALTAPATAATLTMADNTTLTTTTSTSIGKGQYLGTSTNDNATAGNIREFVTSSVAAASAVSLSTGTTANVTSISLTAGDWDVYGGVMFTGGATTNTTFLDGAITVTSATLPTVDGLTCTQWSNSAGQVLGSSSLSIPTNFSRISIASTTTVFLVAQATFTVSTMKAFGMISARRV